MIRMPVRWLIFFLIAFGGGYGAAAQSKSISFNLSTSRSFAPNEAIKIHLYTRNVDQLEFRVYRVSDPVRFIKNLRELHSFGSEPPFGPRERIDERSWLERFHDWKSDLWYRIRQFFRGQFSSAARQELRGRQSALSHKSRIVSEAEFAQIPLLNSQQLVARWRQEVPATYISDNNDLPVKNLGAGLFLVEATDGHFKAYTLLMVSQMALVTRTSAGSVLSYVVDRETGIPIGGATVDAGFGQEQIVTAVTGRDGVADLAIAGSRVDRDNLWVIAAKGNEFAASTPQSYSLNSSFGGQWASYVYTDRPVYRPADTVHWKAILRTRNGNALGLPQAQNVQVAIVDDQDKKLFEQSMPLNPAGYVDGQFTLPRDASLGYYSVRLGDGDNVVSGDFHVEEYRKPEYRVAVTAAEKRVLQGQPMRVTIDSRYFFGEPVANAMVKYRIYHQRHFWYGEDEGSGEDDSPSEGEDGSGYAGDQESEQTGQLDGNGQLVIAVPTRVDNQRQGHGDLDYTIEAGVTDAANREITGRGRFLATYGAFRVEVEPITYAVHTGDTAKFRVTAVDYDNKPVQTSVHIKLVYRHWEQGKSETIEGGSVDVTTDGNGSAVGALPVREKKYSSAELEATAKAVVAGTRDVFGRSYVWIMGAADLDFAQSSAQLQIIADKKTYSPGDVAHLSIVSETAGFDALVVAQGYTVQRREVVHSEGRTLTFDLPITADSQPDISIQVIFLKDNTLYQASKSLKVPPQQQQLQIDIKPTREVFEPQQRAEYEVLTRDFSGKPVSADLSFGAVDDAIYSLYPDMSGDMVKRLYPERYDNSQIESSLTYYFSGEAGTKSPIFAMRNARYRPQLAQVKPGNESKPRIRKVFPDTAYWNPSIRTDAAGRAHVSLTFPDSLTTWRATVHAITLDSKAGSAISRVLVRKNILVRMGTPRFMVKGDELVLPVIVHNYLESAKEAKVSLDVLGLETVSGSAQNLSIPSKSEAAATWQLRARQAGSAKLVGTAITDAESDALELSFPIEPDGVKQSLSKSGLLMQGASAVNQSVIFPVNTDAAAHSLRIRISPSIAGSIFSALDYLSSFPYGCTEQTMSSFLPNVIVAEALSRLQASRQVDAAGLRVKMQAALDRLADYQHDDGGWGWWKEDASQVYMTAYVVSGIGQGAKFVTLRGNQHSMLLQGQQYLRAQLEQHPRMRIDLRAAVVYALAISGDAAIKPPLELQWKRRDELQPEALAMTGLAMLASGDTRAAQLARLLESKAVQQGDLVSWKGSYVPLIDADYDNDAEATAFAMRLIAKTDPNSSLLSRAAQWLMLNQSSGVWNSTEQTAMVVFGLVDYLAASHELESDLTVQVEVNGHDAGQRHFSVADSRSGASFVVDVPPDLLEPGNNSIRIDRSSGSGRVYWSTTGQYYTTDKSQYQAGTMSLNLTRDYYKLQPEQKDGKVLYRLQPLLGEAEVGDVLAVHEAINGFPMKYLLLEDPIPAGTEFVRNEDSYAVDQRPAGWYSWYTHREFHDDRAAFFSTSFGGRQEVFYLLKVVNPGLFHISPARVAPMYQPGIQATSDALQLRVPAPASVGGAR